MVGQGPCLLYNERLPVSPSVIAPHFLSLSLPLPCLPLYWHWVTTWEQFMGDVGGFGSELVPLLFLARNLDDIHRS